MRKPVRKAVIPAAGFGTRFLPFTKAVPKEMVPLVDKPVIQYVVEEAVAAGITDILIVVSSGKIAIQEHFNPAPALEARLESSGKSELAAELRRINRAARLHFVYQQELNGLGDAVYQAKSFVGDDPFAVLLGDTVLDGIGAPVTGQLLDVYDEFGAGVVALEEVPLHKVSRYGVIAGDDLGHGRYKVNHLVEKPEPDQAPSNLVIASRYIFTPAIFSALERTVRGKGNEIQLTDAMKIMLTEQPFYALRFAGRRFDLGNKLEFLKSTVEFGLRREEFREPFLAFLKNMVSKKED